MELELLGRSVELTDGVRDHVEKRVDKLLRLLGDLHGTRVELSRGVSHSQGEVFTAQMTAKAGKRILRAEEMHGELFGAIDLAAEKMQRQIQRFKDRRLDRRHDHRKPEGMAPSTWDETDAEVSAPPAKPRIRRRKRFEIYSMSEEEATEQIELLGHDFFVFRNADSGDVNVLYHRKGGDLGLLEPFLA